MKIWKVETSECIATLEGHMGMVIGIGFSGDGKYIASGDSDGIVMIWEVETSQNVATLSGHRGMIGSVCYSENGRYVASAGIVDMTVKIWEVSISQCTATLRGHTGQVYSVSFSSNGKYLASSSADRTVRIWVNINDRWYCDKIFSASGSPITVFHAKVEKVIASKRNKNVLKQLLDKGKREKNEDESSEDEIGSEGQDKRENESDDEKTDETEGKMGHNLAFA